MNDLTRGLDDGRLSMAVRSLEENHSTRLSDRPRPEGCEGIGQPDSRPQCLDAVGATNWSSNRKGESPSDSPSAGDAASVLALFAASVRRHPDRPAVSDENRTLTYRELDAAASHLARALRARGVRGEQRVAVNLPRGVDVIVAILGILRAGGAYVPVDTLYPDHRRDLMISASGARYTITSAWLTGARVPTTPALTVAELTEATVSTSEVLPAVEAGQASCVLFTSGSSGQPKPIVLEHRNLQYFATNPDLPALTSTDRVAQVSSMSFDAFTYEVWCSLAAGAEIVVLPRMADLVSRDLQRELRRKRITAMLAPTMVVNHIVHEDRDAFSSLRVLHTGGDVVLPASCRKLLSGSFAGVFHNLYGPTEGTTACTAYRINDLNDADDSVPVGRALHGAEVHLLDGNLDEVAAGEVGEVHIGGAGVARGYLDRPTLTAERFLPDPFTTRPGARMYATGDLGRARADGNIEFLGRGDDQVKVRGYRVEPREVERVLMRHGSVRDVAVLPVGQGDGIHLVALVVPDAALAIDALRRYATEILPDYLVPSAFVTIEEITANDHGKRDLTLLRQIAHDEIGRRRAMVPPRDDVERYLSEVWQELLTVEEVGASDDFFALGGNSLLTFRLRQRIHRDLKVRIGIQDVLTVTVLSDLAELLRRQQTVVVS